MSIQKAFQKLATFMLAFMLVISARSQFVNGDFTIPTGPGICNAGASWSFNSTIKPQYVVIGTDRWIDLTECGFYGNGAWMEQNIPTTPGKSYIIRLDLGTWTGWQMYDAGVNITVDALPLNVGANRLFNNVFGANPNWKKVQSCIFVATNYTTVIRIEGNGQNPLNPSYIGGYNAPAIIAVDNVELCDLSASITSLSGTASGCNSYCYTLIENNPGVGTVSWYVDGVLEGTGNDFCRRYPKNIQKELMAIYTVDNACGASFKDTIKTIILTSDDCPCEDIENNINLTYTRQDCNTYNFQLNLTPGYTSAFTQWTIDGEAITGGTTISLSDLLPGLHTICVTMMGGAEGEPGNLCCTKRCVEINVPPPSIGIIQNIFYCPVGLIMSVPTYNPCTDNACNGDYFEYWSNGILMGTSNDPCNDYTVNPTSELRCYEILPNGVKCLKKTINFNFTEIEPVSLNYPDTTIILCNEISTPYNIDPPGWIDANQFEITGPGGFYDGGNLPASGLLTLTPGDYIIKYYDTQTCVIFSRIIHVVYKGLRVIECYVGPIENCSLLNIQPMHFTIMDKIANSCPECINTVQNATYTGQMMNESYIQLTPENGILMVKREYIDKINCTKCILHFAVNYTFTLDGRYPKLQTLRADESGCAWLEINSLPECLRNKWIKGFIVGHPEDTLDYFLPGGSMMSLCCDNPYGIANPTYHFYTPEDPCCFAEITVECREEAPPVERGEGVNNINEDLSVLKIVPNPTSSVFRIASEKGYETYEAVSIMDMNGKLLMTRTTVDSNTEFDVSSFAQGTYVVNVTTKNGIISLKLISVEK